MGTMNKMIMEADAYLIVTPEYNRCVPPALVNTIDHFPPTSFDHKISGIIAYTLGVTGGSFGISAVRPSSQRWDVCPSRTSSASTGSQMRSKRMEQPKTITSTLPSTNFSRKSVGGQMLPRWRKQTSHR